MAQSSGRLTLCRWFKLSCYKRRLTRQFRDFMRIFTEAVSEHSISILSTVSYFSDNKKTFVLLRMSAWKMRISGVEMVIAPVSLCHKAHTKIVICIFQGWAFSATNVKFLSSQCCPLTSDLSSPKWCCHLYLQWAKFPPNFKYLSMTFHSGLNGPNWMVRWWQQSVK